MTATPLPTCPIDHRVVYVADSANNRIKRTPDDGDNWDTIGNGFKGPRAVAADASGRLLFVADTKNNRIQRSTDGGASWQVVSTKGQVKAPQGLAYDERTDRLYVADTKGKRIAVAGNARTDGTLNLQVFAGATFGKSIGKVSQPVGLAVDCAGRVYVADTGNSRIQVNSNGQADGWAIYAGATGGAAVGKVNRPKAIHVDASGRVYVADTGNNRVLINSDGTSAGWQVFMPPGSALGSVRGPEGVVFTASGNVFVSDTINNRIQRKRIDGDSVEVVGSSQFRAPAGLR